MAGSTITNILSVGGTALPTPTGYTVTRNDLDGSGTQRSENGTLHRDRIRGGIYTIEAEWENLSVSQLNTLTTAFSPAKIEVGFFDLTTCQWISRINGEPVYMYAANPSASVSTPGDNTSDMKCSYSVSLIQF